VQTLAGKVVARITDNLEVRKENGSLHTACAKCAADLGPVRENYKDHAVRADNEITAANPNVGDWRRYIDERPVFRQFSCPGCGALLENEIAREGDPVLRDVELDMK
jgi:acetone carboxylase gamma subunit